MTTPVILCGKIPEIASSVIANLKPEYEVIHLIMSLEQGKQELPLLLQGKAVTSSNKDPVDALATHDYSRKAAAILLGAGYDEEAVKELRAACGDASSIPWLRQDRSKPSPPVGPELGKALVARVKEALAELKASGKISQDGILYY